MKPSNKIILQLVIVLCSLSSLAQQQSAPVTESPVVDTLAEAREAGEKAASEKKKPSSFLNLRRTFVSAELGLNHQKFSTSSNESGQEHVTEASTPHPVLGFNVRKEMHKWGFALGYKHKTSPLTIVSANGLEAEEQYQQTTSYAEVLYRLNSDQDPLSHLAAYQHNLPLPERNDVVFHVGLHQHRLPNILFLNSSNSYTQVKNDFTTLAIAIEGRETFEDEIVNVLIRYQMPIAMSSNFKAKTSSLAEAQFGYMKRVGEMAHLGFFGNVQYQNIKYTYQDSQFNAGQGIDITGKQNIVNTTLGMQLGFDF